MGFLAIKGIASIIKPVFGIIQKLGSFGSKALGKAKNFLKGFGKGKGPQDKIPDNVDQIKQEPPPDPTKETPVQDVLDRMPDTEGEKESQKVADELNAKAETRATHASLLYALSSNLDNSVESMNLQSSGDTAKLVQEYRDKSGEPKSSVAALDNTGKILDNQQQMGEALKMNSKTLAEIARTQADSDMTEVMSNRMDAMQQALEDQMGQAQDAMNAQYAENAQNNQGFMKKLGSGIKNTMGLLQGMADKKDRMMAFKEALKEFVYEWGKNFGFLFEGIKILFEKLPIVKWVKKGIGALIGVIQKHVWPTMKKIGAGIAKFSKFMWNKVIKPIGKILPPVLLIRGIVAIVKKIANFFGKSKEEREAEKQAKKDAKEAKKKAKEEAKAAKKAAKEAKKQAKDAAKEVTDDEGIPNQDELAKEGGVDVGPVDTEGVTEPEPVGDVSSGEESDDGDEGEEEEDSESESEEEEPELVEAEDSEAESPGEIGGGTGDMVNDAKGGGSSSKPDAQPDFNPNNFRGMDPDTKYSALSAIAAGKFGMSRDQAYQWMTEGKIKANSKGYLIVNQDVVPTATLAADSTKFNTYAEAQKELSARQAAEAQANSAKLDKAAANSGGTAMTNNNTSMNIVNQPKNDPPSKYDQNLP